VKEIAVGFGPNGRLLGIITSPHSEVLLSDVPAVLLWNAGVLHKVGPFRLFVDIARSLAEAGFPVLRFDVSGKGDSESQKETLLEKERTLKDIQKAMDHMGNRKAASHFVLIGSCSGADEAFEVAAVDPRVTGLIMLDGFGYRTLGYYLHHYGPRLFKFGVWWRFFKGKVRGAMNRLTPAAKDHFERGWIFLREFAPKEVNEAKLQGLLKRQVNMLFVYSGGVEMYYNYRNQFQDMFKNLDFENRITVEYFPEADHTYPEVTSRRILIRTVSDWMRARYQSNSNKALGASRGKVA
jgi:pimeloyl-ACP methyl ester carboxylesterase